MSNENNLVEVDELLNNSTNLDVTWRHSLRQTSAACIAHTLVIQAGINMAFSAVLLPQLRDDQNSISISKSQASWIASLVTISTPCGALVTGALMDYFGRKKVCIFTTLPCLVAWIIHANAKRVWHIYLARTLSGFGGGLSTVALIYVSEITHPNFRSMLLNLNSVFVSFGILVNCIFGFWFNWRTMCYLFACMISVSAALLLLVPESPHWWLTFKNNERQASKSLRYLYRSDQIYENQRELLRKDNTSSEKLQQTVKAYFTKRVTKPLGILFAIFLIQQLSGAYTIIFYAVDVFRKIGRHYGQGLDEFGALVLLGTIRFVVAIISAFLSKRIGRRILLLGSGLGMCASSFLAGMYMANTKIDLTPLDSTILLVLVLAYVCFSSFGFLVIPWTLIGELLPVKVRGKLGGFVIAVAYLLMTAVVKLFPYALEAFEMSFIFCFFALVNILGAVFIYFVVPETLGKSFAEIENYFE